MNKEINGKIKKLRLTKDLTQDYMADRLNITRSTYQKLESGRSHTWAKYLDKLMEVFEITLQEFFSDIRCQAVKQNNFRDNVINEHQEIYDKFLALNDKFIASKDEQIALLKDLYYSLLEKK